MKMQVLMSSLHIYCNWIAETCVRLNLAEVQFVNAPIRVQGITCELIINNVIFLSFYMSLKYLTGSKLT